MDEISKDVLWMCECEMEMAQMFCKCKVVELRSLGNSDSQMAGGGY